MGGTPGEARIRQKQDNGDRFVAVLQMVAGQRCKTNVTGAVEVDLALGEILCIPEAPVFGADVFGAVIAADLLHSAFRQLARPFLLFVRMWRLLHAQTALKTTILAFLKALSASEMQVTRPVDSLHRIAAAVWR